MTTRMARLAAYAWRRSRPALPVLLDVAGFLAIVIGTAILFGAWAWLVAGVLLILSGIRAQT